MEQEMENSYEINILVPNSFEGSISSVAGSHGGGVVIGNVSKWRKDQRQTTLYLRAVYAPWCLS